VSFGDSDAKEATDTTEIFLAEDDLKVGRLLDI
jgi:hypothetical protein